MIGVTDIISSSLMKKTDAYATSKLGIPSIILMENAGLNSFNILKNKPFKTYTIVCGVGNNGGDGLVLAKHLFIAKKIIYLNIIGDLDKQTENFKENLSIIKNIGINYRHIKNSELDIEILKNQTERSDAVVDAIFGIGLTREVTGIFSQTIDTINQFSKYTISLDIPSGLEADNGTVLGNCVKANQTISFYKAKNALVNERYYCGEVDVVSIGIPYELNIE